MRRSSQDFDDFRPAGRARHGRAPGTPRRAARRGDGPTTSRRSRSPRARPASGRGVLLSPGGRGRARPAVAARIGAQAATTGATRCCRSPTRPRACSTRRAARRGLVAQLRRVARDRSRATWRELRRRSSSRRRSCFERVRAEVELRIGRAGRLKRRAYGFGMRCLAAALEARRRGGSARLSAFVGRALVGRFVRDKAGLLERALRRHRRGAGRAGPPRLVLDARRAPARAVRPGRDRRDRDRPARGRGRGHGRGADRSGDRGPARARRRALVRSPGLHVGRFGEGVGGAPDDGWYATGDLVRLDEQGRLVPLDRRSQLLTTTAAEVVSPAADRESSSSASSYISAAVVVAEGRPFVGALLELQLEAVGDWARAREKPVTTYAALAADGDVQRLVGEQVEAANDSLGEAERVARLRDHDPPARRRAHRHGNDPARDRARALRDADRGPLRRPGRRRRCLTSTPRHRLKDVRPFLRPPPPHAGEQLQNNRLFDLMQALWRATSSSRRSAVHRRVGLSLSRTDRGDARGVRRAVAHAGLGTSTSVGTATRVGRQSPRRPRSCTRSRRTSRWSTTQAASTETRST